MRWIQGALWVFVLASLVTLVASIPVEGQYQSRAKLIQRIQQDPGADLFGEAGTPIGSPQMIIIDDPRAFIGQKDATGAELVSENYLKEKAIYPLQLQTVKFVLSNVRLASGAALGVSLVGIWLIKRRAAKRHAA